MEETEVCSAMEVVTPQQHVLLTGTLPVHGHSGYNSGSYNSGHGHGMGMGVGGVLAGAAAAYGASHMTHGGYGGHNHGRHVGGGYGHHGGTGYYGHHDGHGKFKHGKFGKGMHGHHKGKFKGWK